MLAVVIVFAIVAVFFATFALKMAAIEYRRRHSPLPGGFEVKLTCKTLVGPEKERDNDHG
jgi:hypothetical protein